MSHSHFGFNGFVSSTEVALSYKSVDYFSADLPVINSLPADAWNFIEQYKCGLNFSAETIQSLVQTVLSLTVEDHSEMREGARRLFREVMSFEPFTKSLRKLCQDLLDI